MGKGKTANYWRDKINAEPIDYALAPDPNRGGAFESGRDVMLDFIDEAARILTAWLRNHDHPLDGAMFALKQKWFNLGGKPETWETIFKSAATKSKYAKIMSREIRELGKEVPAPKIPCQNPIPAKIQPTQNLVLANISRIKPRQTLDMEALIQWANRSKA